jgi:hypothetical protein
VENNPVQLCCSRLCPSTSLEREEREKEREAREKERGERERERGERERVRERERSREREKFTFRSNCMMRAFEKIMSNTRTSVWNIL